MKINEIIKDGKGTIVDVRTPEEFKTGNAAGSVNIPLHTVLKRLDEIKALKQPLILCCASGNRSEHAIEYLTQAGIESFNGGSWMNINSQALQKVLI